MKKALSLVTVLVLCFALTVPAFAADVEFVPSITAKPAPEVVVGGTTVKIDGTEDVADGEDAAFTAVVEVKNETKEVVYTAPVVDLVITAVSQVQVENTEETVAISEEAVKTLKEAYTQLSDESFKLSEESPELLDQMKEMLVEQVIAQMTKELEEQGTEAIESAIAAVTDSVESNIAAIVDAAVVTALFDVSILSEELEEYLNVDDHTIDLTFKADIPEDHHVIVMVFKENKWQTIKNVIVNGDGTITCTFEHFCPVAILTAPKNMESPETNEPENAPEEETTEPKEVPDTDNDLVVDTTPEADAGGFAWWWIVLIAAAVVVVIVVAKNKGRKNNAEAKK